MKNIYKLKYPIEWKGEQITELALDFENMSVPQLEQAEKEAEAYFDITDNPMLREYDKRYQAVIAAYAAGVPVEAIRTCKLFDYKEICSRANLFLQHGAETEEDIINLGKEIQEAKKSVAASKKV